MNAAWIGLIGTAVGVALSEGFSLLKDKRRWDCEKDQRAREAVQDLATALSLIALRVDTTRGRPIEELGEEAISASMRVMLSAPPKVRKAADDIRQAYGHIGASGGVDRLIEARNELLKTAHASGLQ